MATVMLQSRHALELSAWIRREDPSMDKTAQVALKKLGEQIKAHRISPDKKLITFQLQRKILGSHHDRSWFFLSLRVIKGSVFTTTWNTFARFDDEYVMYYHETIEAGHEQQLGLWHIQGVDPINSKISHGSTDWLLARRIQIELGIATIGLLGFCKLLGRMLLSLPLFIDTGRYTPPMPSTFMLSYLWNVVNCPFELSCGAAAALLGSAYAAALLDSNVVLDVDMAHQLNRRNEQCLTVLRHFIKLPGEAQNIQHYRIVHNHSHKTGYQQQEMSDMYCEEEGLVLQHQPRLMNISRTSQHQQQQELHGGVSQFGGVGVHSTLLSSGEHTPTQQLPDSCIVRVVEIRAHPVGIGGFIAVLEQVTLCNQDMPFCSTSTTTTHHQQQQQEGTQFPHVRRYVALDILKVAAVVQLAGRDPPEVLRLIHNILSEHMWRRLLRDYEQQQQEQQQQQQQIYNNSTHHDPELQRQNYADNMKILPVKIYSTQLLPTLHKFSTVQSRGNAAAETRCHKMIRLASPHITESAQPGAPVLESRAASVRFTVPTDHTPAVNPANTTASTAAASAVVSTIVAADDHTKVADNPAAVEDDLQQESPASIAAAVLLGLRHLCKRDEPEQDQQEQDGHQHDGQELNVTEQDGPEKDGENSRACTEDAQHVFSGCFLDKDVNSSSSCSNTTHSATSTASAVSLVPSLIAANTPTASAANAEHSKHLRRQQQQHLQQHTSVLGEGVVSNTNMAANTASTVVNAKKRKGFGLYSKLPRSFALDCTTTDTKSRRAATAACGGVDFQNLSTWGGMKTVVSNAERLRQYMQVLMLQDKHS